MYKALFLIVLLSSCDAAYPPIMSATEAQKEKTDCIKKGWDYNFVFDGKKDINHVQMVLCDDPKQEQESRSIDDDDDDSITSTGMPSMTGLPGAPF